MHHAERPRRPVLRVLVLLAVLIGWLGLAGSGGMAMGSLSQVQENDQAAFLPESAESTRAAAAQREFVEQTTLPALLVISADGGLDDAHLGAIQAFAERVPDLPLGAEDAVLSDLLAGPVVPIPSEDGRAALVTVPLDAETANEQLGEDRAVQLAVDALRTAAHTELGDGLRSWVTGPAGFVTDLVEAFAGIDGILLAVALGVVLVILVLVYRSPLLPFAVILTAVFGLSGAALVVYQLARSGALVLNGQSQGILFILVVGAATDYSLLLVARYREELRHVPDPFRAMGRAIRRSLPPIAASAGTVILGLLCLLLSDLESNSSLGPVAAIGIGAAFLAALTLLPALLLVAGRRSRVVFWPRIPHPQQAATGAGRQDGAPTSGESLAEIEARAGIWGRVSALVGRSDRLVWVTTTVALAVAAAFLPTFRASGTSETDIFRTEVESVAGQEVLAQHFDAGVAQPVVVIAPEQDAGAVLDAVVGIPGVEQAAVRMEPTGAGGPPAGEGMPDGAGTPGGGSPGGDGADGPPPSAGQGPPTGQDEPAAPLVVDGRVSIDVVTGVAADSAKAAGIVQDIRAAVHDVAPGTLVGGAAAERLDTQLTSARDLRIIIPTVLVVVLLVLVLLLRAILAPVLLMIANVLSFAAALGISAVVFNHVLDLPGADAGVPLYAFVFLIALGIDYSIFLMTRVREEAVHHGTREGVRRGLTVTGGVITSAGVVLAATFSALVVIPLLFLLQLAFIVALGVLIDTLVVRSLLVPGLVHDVGRVVWWPWGHRIGA